MLLGSVWEAWAQSDGKALSTLNELPEAASHWWRLSSISLAHRISLQLVLQVLDTWHSRNKT